MAAIRNTPVRIRKGAGAQCQRSVHRCYAIFPECLLCLSGIWSGKSFSEWRVRGSSGHITLLRILLETRLPRALYPPTVLTSFPSALLLTHHTSHPGACQICTYDYLRTFALAICLLCTSCFEYLPGDICMDCAFSSFCLILYVIFSEAFI